MEQEPDQRPINKRAKGFFKAVALADFIGQTKSRLFIHPNGFGWRAFCSVAIPSFRVSFNTGVA
jgi:hypothetical protein